MSDQLSVFDLLDATYEPEPPKPEPTLAPKMTPEETRAVFRGDLPMQANYVHLGWHKGNPDKHQKTVFSAQTSQVDAGESIRKQQTVYVVPVPLPEAWLKDPAMHPKALEYETAVLLGMGFMIRRNGPGKWDEWEINDNCIDEGLSSNWKVENCLCPGCRWLKDECKCEVNRCDEPRTVQH